MSRVTWRPPPGRKFGWAVVAGGDDLLGVIGFGSPVINLACRDARLGAPSDPSERGRWLRQVAEMNVCVAAQPIGWHWNIGKLLAMLAPTVADEWAERYGDELLWVTTMGAYGRPSQYDRVMTFLGYTKGYGHEHIDDAAYHRMMLDLIVAGEQVESSRFGAGSNPRMRRIAQHRKTFGGDAPLRHGQERAVYAAPAAPAAERLERVARWYERWGLPRFRSTSGREPPYEPAPSVLHQPGLL